VNLHGIPQFTEGIDLFVEPSPENVERLRRALGRIWSDPEIAQIRAEDLGGEYAVVRYGTPDGFAVDLVARIGEVSSYEDLESETLQVAGLWDLRSHVRVEASPFIPSISRQAFDLRAAAACPPSRDTGATSSGVASELALGRPREPWATDRRAGHDRCSQVETPGPRTVGFTATPE
jgi:hypothetical protein